MLGGVLQLAVQVPALLRIGALPRIGLAPARAARRLARTPACGRVLQADGAGAARRVGGAALAADQHADRLAPGRRRGVVADLCRPADGVPDRAARRGAGRGAAAAAVGRAGRRATRRATPACSTGACAWCCCWRCPARWRCWCSRSRWWRCCTTTARSPPRDVRPDRARADGLRRRPDGPDRREDPRAGLLRAAGHPHAGDASPSSCWC